MKSCPHCGLRGAGYAEQPKGYVAAEEWAEDMLARGYVQQPCPGCGRLTIWVRVSADEEHASA